MDKNRESLESFVSRVQNTIPALKDAKVEYQRTDSKQPKQLVLAEHTTNKSKSKSVRNYWTK